MDVMEAKREPGEEATCAGSSAGNPGQQSDERRCYEIVLCVKQPISSSDVVSFVSQKFSRREHPDAKLRTSIQLSWEKKLAANPKLFNGTKFRFASFEYCFDGLESQVWGIENFLCEAKLAFALSVTDYASFLGTNWSERSSELKADGMRLHSDTRCFLADPLGVGAVCITLDEKIIFIRRSKHVAEYPEYLDLPGGHPEPQNVEQLKLGEEEEIREWPWQTEKNSSASFDIKNISQLVTEEIFSSIKMEIHEEIGVPFCCLTAPRLLGILRNLESTGRPSLCFLVTCKLDSRDVLQHYRAGPVEAGESTDLFLINADEISGSHLRSKMTPATLGCLELWKISTAASTSTSTSTRTRTTSTSTDRSTRTN